MKVLPIIISCCILLTSGKLVEKNTEKNYETKPTEAHSLMPHRVSRQAFYDEGLGISIEDYNRNYVRKGRYSVKASKYSDERPGTAVRVTRDSKEKQTAGVRKPVDVSVESKPTSVLIKKPIPKFMEADYEDFQMKVNRSPIRSIDSSEHEDEDFNLGDYEFDVNHDEFIGRGKPLEPLMISKINKESTKTKIWKTKPTTSAPVPDIKIQSKVVIPASPASYVKRNVLHNKAADKMKEDYYDDVVTTTKVPEMVSKLDDDFDEADSVEFNRRTSVRSVRSPWSLMSLADKMGSKGAMTLANILSDLPLFPIPEPLPSKENIVDVPNLDPSTGREFAF